MVVGQGEQATDIPLPAELGESWEKKDAKSEIHTRAETRSHLKRSKVACWRDLPYATFVLILQ